MRQSIKLMADYGSSPLWGLDPENVGNIAPSSLPLSEDLRSDLRAWAEHFDRTLNQDYPPEGGFSSDAEELAFDEDGRKLWRRLQKELGDSYTVKYYSVAERRVLDPDGA
jgi:hypothetical protein